MGVFSDYLKDASEREREALEHIISLVRQHVPDAREGHSYGFPAFKYRGRPLLGFGLKNGVLSLYPFDPRIVSAVKHELEDFEVGKGFIRFSPEHPIPDKVILLIVDLRLEYLNKNS